MTDRPPPIDFTPISPNPYIVGNPVRGRAMFFGRETEFELVRRRFQDSKHGGLLVFCGERRSGKTSILFQILEQRLGPEFIPVLIDMQSMAIGSEVEFLTRLSEEVLAALGPEADRILPPEFTEDSNHTATFQKFIRRVLEAHPQKKLILLFDEYELFETKIDTGHLHEDVLHILASLMENQPVFLIFTGSQHLEQRRREYWKILGKSIYKMISYLEREDAINLVRKPVEGRANYDDGAVETIYRLTAGQPFYTQATCQTLIDHLNDRHLTQVTREMVFDVVDGIVNNPLPQMIFLWDGLERDEKLALALLAEALDDGEAHAGVEDLKRLLHRRGYPLDLDLARLATALEKLFKGEFLLRRDRAHSQYAFRMDLWRLWIRRQHSVWQVMREEGLELRPVRPKMLRWVAAGGALAVLAIAWGIGGPLRDRRDPGSRGREDDLAPRAFLALEVVPDDAMVYLDGRRAGMGAFRDSITADHDHRIRVTAPGHADSEAVARLPAGTTQTRRIELRVLLGDLRVETDPPGVEIMVDGRQEGISPVVVRSLAVNRLHRIEALRAGLAPVQRDVTVRPDSSVSIMLRLAGERSRVLLTSDPLGCDVKIAWDGGGTAGTTPVEVALPAGRSRFVFARQGYQDAETTLVVAPGQGRLHMMLVRESPGVLVVQGDRPAQIYVDGSLVVENVQNSGPRELASGAHLVRVVLVTGESSDHSVMIRTRERAIYDYSRGTVSYRPEGARQP